MGYNCNAGIRWGCKYNAKGYSRHLIYHYVFNIHFVRYSLLLIGLINICSCKVIDFLRVLTCVYIFRLLCSQLNCLKTLNFAVYCVYSYLVGDKCILREFFFPQSTAEHSVCDNLPFVNRKCYGDRRDRPDDRH